MHVLGPLPLEDEYNRTAKPVRFQRDRALVTVGAPSVDRCPMVPTKFRSVQKQTPPDAQALADLGSSAEAAGVAAIPAMAARQSAMTVATWRRGDVSHAGT